MRYSCKLIICTKPWNFNNRTNVMDYPSKTIAAPFPLSHSHIAKNVNDMKPSEFAYENLIYYSFFSFHYIDVQCKSLAHLAYLFPVSACLMAFMCIGALNIRCIAANMFPFLAHFLFMALVFKCASRSDRVSIHLSASTSWEATANKRNRNSKRTIQERERERQIRDIWKFSCFDYLLQSLYCWHFVAENSIPSMIIATAARVSSSSRFWFCILAPSAVNFVVSSNALIDCSLFILGNLGHISRVQLSLPQLEMYKSLCIVFVLHVVSSW